MLLAVVETRFQRLACRLLTIVGIETARLCGGE